jgi:hypothetical protein
LHYRISQKSVFRNARNPFDIAACLLGPIRRATVIVAMLEAFTAFFCALRAGIFIATPSTVICRA